MYLTQTLARDRYRDALDQACEARQARHMAELRRAERQGERAERKMIDAWRRADELRAVFDDAR